MQTAAKNATDVAKLADTLVRLSHVVQRVFADVSRENGLTPQQGQLLCMLIDGPVGMSELSRLLHLEKSSLTGLVDRIEQHGLVERKRDPHDRRVYKIALTRHGGEAAARSHKEITARLDTLADELRLTDARRVTSAITQILSRDAIDVSRNRPRS